MKKLNLKKRKGGALVFTLLVMLIMTILGTTLLQISLAENKMAIRDKNRIEAYYLARAGVETTAAYLIDNATPEADINQIVDKKSDEISYGKGTFNVELIKDPTAGSHSIIVKGTGTVNGVSENAILEVNVQGNPEGLAFENAYFGNLGVNFGGSSEVIATPNGPGNVGSNGDITYGKRIYIDGTIQGNISPKKQYPSPVFPTDPDTASPKTLYPKNKKEPPNTFDMRTDKILTYSTLTAENKADLIVYTGTDTPVKPASIVVGTLDFKNAEINVDGTNPLYIFVKKAANIGGVNAGGDSKNVFLFMGDGSNLTLGYGHSAFKGFIYGPGATLDTKGTQDIYGGIIINNVVDNKINGDYKINDETLKIKEIHLGDLPVQIYKTVNWLD